MTEPLHLTVYFDFLCPFAYRTVKWIDTLQDLLGEQLHLEWKYFSLEQTNNQQEGWYLWEQPEQYPSPLDEKRPGSKGLLAFWGAEAARQQGQAAFDRYRTLVYDARQSDTATRQHLLDTFGTPSPLDPDAEGKPNRLDMTDRASFEWAAHHAGLDMDRFQHDFHNRDMVDAIRCHYEEGVNQFEVFGVPTLVFNNTDAVYVKTMSIPPRDEALALLAEIRASFARPEREWLAELKRPNIGRLR